MTALNGKVALVTGGGRGLGRAHALGLARGGARVVVNDVGSSVHGAGRADDVAAAVVDEIVAAGGSATADTSDISSYAGAAQAVHTALAAYGHLDILINNAGITGRDHIEHADPSDLDRMLGVHLTGTLGTIRAALPGMRQRRWGRIVSTVSEVALRPVPGGMAMYGAAKAAIWSNAISPGARTRMSADSIEARPTSAAMDLDPVHVARVVAYLASDEAGDINGRVIHVAGTNIREYLEIRRSGDTELVRRLISATGQSTPLT